MIVDRIIKIEIKQQYGKDVFYPACNTGFKFLKLTGKKTFSEKDLHMIIELGFIVTKAKNKQYENIFKG
jgi:hypothetical protein